MKSVDHFTTSEQVRIIAVVAAALSGRGSAEGAHAFFKLALAKVQNLDRQDPAAAMLQAQWEKLPPAGQTWAKAYLLNVII